MRPKKQRAAIDLLIGKRAIRYGVLAAASATALMNARQGRCLPSGLDTNKLCIRAALTSNDETNDLDATSPISTLDEQTGLRGSQGAIQIANRTNANTTSLLKDPHIEDAQLPGCSIPEYYGGWHAGRWVDELTREKGMTWRQCAEACAQDDDW